MIRIFKKAKKALDDSSAPELKKRRKVVCLLRVRQVQSVQLFNLHAKHDSETACGKSLHLLPPINVAHLPLGQRGAV